MMLVVLSGKICWEKISEHRKRGPAVRACEKDATFLQRCEQAAERCRALRQRRPIRRASSVAELEEAFARAASLQAKLDALS